MKPRCTYMLNFAESDASRLARALSEGEYAERVELCWEKERTKPFWKMEGVLPWLREFKDELLKDGTGC